MSIVTQITEHPVRTSMIALALAVLASMTFSIVPEDKQALLLRYGTITGVVNSYKPDQPFGSTNAGLIARIPFVEQIKFIDKRVLGVNMERQQVLSTDQLRLQVDAFARFRIVDPAKMYTTIQTEDKLRDQLGAILGSSLRNELGKRAFATLLSPERGQIMDNIQAGLNREAAKYGAEIIDVRIKRADLPQGTPLTSAYQRMQTARNQEAISIQAEGRKEAQLIRADADAEAANIYASAFGKDPGFYDFYRAMQAYQKTFVESDGATSVVLSPDNEFLREFQGR
ncbi:protease modulator HflC [Sphingorhabdus soli]|uniref:Protein HflC n=1 Tax=Flavisphingopyxis soli TaxID=2601267 RepID=A0A5C6UKG1_9SPHN|nr:protease modulator HflC [Sphingorhabdus soli]TXC73249.1 protease modulator HflC [Sphingorhabdus soli]